MIQRVLILLGEVMQCLATSRKGRENLPVLPRLTSAWVLAAADNSAEFRIALALVGLAQMRPYLAPVVKDKGHWQWSAESRLFVWGRGDLVRNLMRVVERRGIEAQRGPAFHPFESKTRLGAGLSNIQAFLDQKTDDGLIADLIQGLIWADLPDALPPSAAEGEEGMAPPLPAAYAVCKPFFASVELLKYLGRLPQDARLATPPELSRLLAAGQTRLAVEQAWRRNRIAGLGWPQGGAPQTPNLDGPRLLAALAIPLQSGALLELLPRLATQPPA